MLTQLCYGDFSIKSSSSMIFTHKAIGCVIVFLSDFRHANENPLFFFPLSMDVMTMKKRNSNFSIFILIVPRQQNDVSTSRGHVTTTSVYHCFPHGCVG